MKILALFIGLFLLLSIPSIAVEDTEIMTYASGVLAATDQNAQAKISGDMLIVGREASEYEIQDAEFALRQASDLAEAANTIATHFPGRFKQSMGLLMDTARLGKEPFIGCMITYRI